MCLSTVYKGEATPANLLLSNVQRMERQNGTIILTDLMERQVAIEGEILMADLVGGTVIIAEKA